MSDVSQEQLLAVTKRVVDKYTFEALLFTSLDVSNAVKQTLPTVRHREVAPIVRTFFDDAVMGDTYTRTLIDVMAGGARGKKAEAYLYHLSSASAADYTDDQRQQLSIPPVSASLTDDDVDLAIDESRLEVGKDGRGRMPRQLLENAGIKTERIRVDLEDGGQIMVLSSLLPGDPGGGIATLTYVHPTQLHIPASLMQMFNLQKPISAKVEAADGVVSIRGTLAGS